MTSSMWYSLPYVAVTYVKMFRDGLQGQYFVNVFS